MAGIALVALLAMGVSLLLAGGGGAGVVPQANSVGRIDAGARAFTATVRVGEDPTGVAVGEDGDVWVINQGDSTVSRIDSGTGEVASTKSTLGIPTGIAPGEDAVWITNGFGSASGTQVVRVDLTDESVEAAFPSGNAKAIVVAFGSIWLADPDRDVVVRYEADDPSEAPIEIPVDDDAISDEVPRSLAVGEGAAGGIWVANELGDTVVRIDPKTNEVVDRIPVDDPTAIAADGSGVWVTSETNDRVHLFDPGDGRPLDTYETADGIPDGPTAIVIAPDATWVGSDLVAEVVRIDRAADSTDRLRLAGITGSMSVDREGDVWVTVRAQS